MRYAIYYSPEHKSPLEQCGSAWLSRDAFTGQTLPPIHIGPITHERFLQLTTEPRRYGFHGTLKPPFALQPSFNLSDLSTALADFARKTAPFLIDGLAVTTIGRFLALTPATPSAQLSELAANCVREFDHMRAIQSQADIERRRQAGLSPAQDRYLLDWGYPYIFEFFRFHMTLSNKLEDGNEAKALHQAATQHFSAHINQPHKIETLVLACEEERGKPFKIISTFALEGQTK
ncbi:DUF1045 domain-containing protein [Polycladidibacter stylochi]|uniref:DUF1045 domain-containing protein n=1 Tax=Polycladidibacter stylochi TaxID=1807766 RepID=UPI0008340FE3|nr:DUF1045 domain-containing protein [Pseudovibrio stylochi]